MGKKKDTKKEKKENKAGIHWWKLILHKQTHTFPGSFISPQTVVIVVHSLAVTTYVDNMAMGKTETQNSPIEAAARLHTPSRSATETF